MYLERVLAPLGDDTGESPDVLFEVDAEYHLTEDGRGVLEAIHVYHDAHDMTPYLSDEYLTRAESDALQALSSKHPEATWTPGEVV
uniref:Uncharacterized protein n=1 Tax=viral metagenome TaxID=1070528 RepID=A0A6M3LKY0_9ZZZZ